MRKQGINAYGVAKTFKQASEVFYYSLGKYAGKNYITVSY